MDEQETEDSQVADGALQNLEEAIRMGRTDVVVRTLDIASSHLHDGQAGVANRILNRTLASGNTCLHLAVSQGHSDIVRAILHAGADPSMRNSSGSTPFELASTDQAQMPFTAHAMEAIAVGSLGVIGQLLSAGMSVDHASKVNQYNTLLHWACHCAALPIVRHLVARNAKLDAVNGEGFTPLHEAVKRWNAPIVEFLLENGADPDFRVTSGSQAGATAQDLVPATHSWSELRLSNGDATIPSGNAPPLLIRSGESMDSLGAGVAVSTAHEPMVAGHPLQVLWPPPSIIRCMDGVGFSFQDSYPAYYCLGDSSESFADALSVFSNAAAMFEESCRASSFAILPSGGPVADGALVLSVNSDYFSSSDSYNITITEERISLEASDLPGLWYGLQTLAQIFRVYVRSAKHVLPALYIRDWPDLRYRGFMLDLMQGRLPTMETLQGLIVIMSSLKMNMLQLRMGARSFAYVGLEDMWREDECYTPSEMQGLSVFAKTHFVSLVPHQDTISLASTLLRRDSCRGFSIEKLGSTIVSLQQQLFACFPDSKFAHVGLDQPLSSILPSSSQPADGADAFESLLWMLHSSCRLHRRYMQIWGSELQIRYPLLSMLPSSVFVMQPLGQFSREDNAPFCRHIVQSGVNLIVCPDGLAKESVGGRPHTSMAQLVAVAQCATHYRAVGMMLTEFADFGHVHPLVANVVPLTAAAGLAWRTGTPLNHLEQHIPNVINQFVLMDDAEVVGPLLLDLQLVHSALLCPQAPSRPSPQVSRSVAHSNASSDSSGSAQFAADMARASASRDPSLFLHSPAWWQPAISSIALRPDKFVLPPLSAEVVQGALREVRHCQAVLANLRLSCAQSTAILSELSFIVELCMFVCRATKQMVLGNRTTGTAAEALSGLSPTARTDLANRLISVAQLFREAWLCRNLPGSVDQPSLFFQRTLSILHNSPSS